MPFGSDNDLIINIEANTQQAEQRLEEISATLDQIAANTNPVARSFRRVGTAIDSTARGLGRATTGFSNFQKQLITLDAALRVVRRGVNVVRNSIAGFFDTLEDAQRIEGLSRSFVNLQASVGRFSGDSLQNLRQATRGLVSDLQLFQAANEAVILRVDDGSEGFEKLAAAAVKLGQATGRTAAQAIGDLTQGIGRQSRLILDNLGIVVRVEEAYERYAAALGKSTKELTEQEQQAAFTALATERIVEAANTLADIQETAGTATQRLNATLSNLSTQYLQALSDNDSLNDSINNLSDTLDDVNVEDFAKDVGELSARLINLGTSAIEPVTGFIADFNRGLKVLDQLLIDIKESASNFGTTIRDDIIGILKSTGQIGDSLLGGLPSALADAFKGLSLDSSILPPTTTNPNDILDILIPGSAEIRSQIEARAGNLLEGTISEAARKEAERTRAALEEELTGALDVITKSGVLAEGLKLEGVSKPVIAAVGQAVETLNKLQEKGIKLTEEQQRAVLKAELAFTGYGAKLKDTGKNTNDLSAAQRKLNTALEATERSALGLASTLGTAPINPFVTQIEALVTKLEDGTITTAEYNIEVEKLIKNASSSIDELKSLGKAFDTVNKNTAKAKAEQERLNTELEKVIEQLEKLDPNYDPLAGVSEGARKAIEDFEAGRISAAEFGDVLAELREKGELGAKGIDAAAKAAQDAAREAQRAKDAFSDLFGVSGNFLDNLGGIFGDDFSLGIDPEGLLGNDFGRAVGSVLVDGVVGAIQNGDIEAAFIDVGAQAGAAVGGALAGPIGAAIGEQLGDKIAENITQIGDSVKDTAGGLVDTIFPGIGTLGEEVFGGLFGDSRDLFQEARDAFENFFDEISSSGIDLDFDIAGDVFDDVILSTGEARKAFGETFDQFTVQLEDGTVRTNELGLQLANLGETTLDLLPTFEGLAAAIAGAFDIDAGLISDQLGEILALNLQDELGLNQLQLAFERAGIGAEEFGQALEDAYFRGEISAQEFLNAQQSTADLFEVGIPGAVGAVDAAFANLASGGLKSGQEGLDALRDIGAEALDLNVQSIDELGNALIKSGADVEQVTALMDALAQAGITTTEALANIDLTQAAQIISNLESVGFEFLEVQGEIENTRALLEEFRREASNPIRTRIVVDVEVNDPEGGAELLRENGGGTLPFSGENQ